MVLTSSQSSMKSATMFCALLSINRRSACVWTPSGVDSCPAAEAANSIASGIDPHR